MLHRDSVNIKKKRQNNICYIVCCFDGRLADMQTTKPIYERGDLSAGGDKGGMITQWSVFSTLTIPALRRSWDREHADQTSNVGMARGLGCQ